MPVSQHQSFGYQGVKSGEIKNKKARAHTQVSEHNLMSEWVSFFHL